MVKTQGSLQTKATCGSKACLLGYRVCPEGHSPTAIICSDSGTWASVECKTTTKVGRRFEMCSFKKTWRHFSEFLQHIPNNVGPRTLCKLLFWFSQRCPLEQLMEYTSLKKKSCSKCCGVIRKALARYMLKLSDSELLGDHPKTVVCIDETYFTKKKRTRSGFRVRWACRLDKI